MDANKWHYRFTAEGEGEATAALRADSTGVSRHTTSGMQTANGEIYGYDCGELGLFRKGTS